MNDNVVLESVLRQFAEYLSIVMRRSPTEINQHAETFIAALTSPKAGTYNWRDDGKIECKWAGDIFVFDPSKAGTYLGAWERVDPAPQPEQGHE